MIKPFASQLAQHLSDTHVHVLWRARLLDGHPYSEASYHLSYLKMLSVKGKPARPRENGMIEVAVSIFLLTTTRLVSRSFASVRVRPEAVWLLSPFLGLQTSADVLTMKTAESYNAAPPTWTTRRKRCFEGYLWYLRTRFCSYLCISCVNPLSVCYEREKKQREGQKCQK